MKKVVTVIQVLLILIFAGCAAYMCKYFYDAHNAQEQFDELKAEVKARESADASGNYGEQYADNGMLMSYYSLYEQNNDMVGWLKIEGTQIDYPVVQAEDNEYYLHRDFHKNNQYSGIPFLDYQSLPGGESCIIYAHNMRNGSMFAAISKYENKDFYEAHREIRFDTLYERGKYEVISVLRTTVGSKNEFKYYEYADIETEERFNEYVSKAKALSEIDTAAEAEYGDSLLTLSTCAYHTSNERLVVVAVKKE